MTGARIPNFLIVGAMKGGTTTLYYDLSAHPDLHLPARKEPEILVGKESDEEIMRVYAHHFRNAADGQMCGEASTAYTKRPVFEGVAERARQLLGPDLRIIYVTRNPVARAISHYRHDRQYNNVALGFDAAVRNEPRFIDFGRYDWQIEPWKAQFGTENVLEFSLETYSANRREMLNKTLTFLGVDPALCGPIDPESKSNTAQDQKAISNALLRYFVYSSVYQHYIKPLIPRHVRERMRRSMLTEPEIEKIEVSAELKQYILEQSALPGIAASAA